jgi:steroid delta-isomerase-like uncharacterized protein
MSAEENKEIVHRFEEAVWNERNPSRVGEFFAASHVFRAPGGPPLDFEGHRQMIAHFQSAFPDGQNSSDELLADGDKVVQRWTYRGTHRGPFQGIPPTGTQVTLSGIAIWRFENGKIVESWHEMDTLGLLQQLGAIPTANQPG